MSRVCHWQESLLQFVNKKPEKAGRTGATGMWITAARLSCVLYVSVRTISVQAAWSVLQGYGYRPKYKRRVLVILTQKSWNFGYYFLQLSTAQPFGCFCTDSVTVCCSAAWSHEDFISGQPMLMAPAWYANSTATVIDAGIDGSES
jgi:hypothetical protein